MTTSIPHRFTVADVMSRQSFCVRPTTSLREVVDLMATYDVGALPVADADGLPLGVVSATDLLPCAEGIMPLSGHAGAGRGERCNPGRGPTATRAGDIMSSPALTIAVDASVAVAARRLLDGRAHQLVAVDARGHVRGMVSRADLLRVFVRSYAEIHHDIVAGSEAAAAVRIPA